MDIALFSKIVKSLLSENDSVAIPGLGTFVAEDVPASFSDRGFTINPPYRTVSFVGGGADDGMLVRFYALSNKLELPQAEQVVNDFIAGMRAELETSKSVDFPLFGRIRLIGQGRMIFVQDENLEIFPHLDYLEPVSLKSLGEVAEKPDVREEDKSVDSKAVKPARRKALPVWAVILIVLLSLAAAGLASLAVVGRLAPDFVDQFLYNAEQLEILRARI